MRPRAPTATRRASRALTIVCASQMAGQPWNDAREALAGLAELYARYDTDGLDVYFLNDPRCRVNLRVRAFIHPSIPENTQKPASLLTRPHF